ncbi:MAG: carboxypeptidase regulatory-like domain-containing protein [Candidatus Sumerlaeaceae bacterium]
MLTAYKKRLFLSFQVFFACLCGLSLSFAQEPKNSPLSGVIVGPDQRPIKGASIDFLPARAEFQLPEDLVPRASVVSDDGGNFSLPVEASRDFVIIAHAPGFRRARFAFTDLPKGYTKVGLALERGENIRGTVMDAITGQRIGDAEIGPVVLSPDEDMSLTKKHVPVWTRSAPDGSFTIDGLMPRRTFQFLVRKPGYELENVQAKAGVDNLVVRLKKGGSRVNGVVASPSQPPEKFAGQRVWLNGNGFNFITKTDSQGRFVYEGLPPGNFSIEALVEHPRVSQVQLIELPRDNGKELRVLVSEGYWLSGTVYDATTSTPAAGVVLKVEDRITTSGRDGAFRIGPLWLVGKPTIEILEESGYVLASPPLGALVVQGETDGFRNIDGDTVWVRPIRRVQVKVAGYDLTTQPLQLVFVGENGAGIVERMTTDVHVLRLKTEQGGILWCTDNQSWATRLASVGKAAPPLAKVSLTLQPSAQVQGRVLRPGDGGTTSARPTVRLIPEKLVSHALDHIPAVYETGTAADGWFRFPCVSAGDYRLVAAAAGGTVERSRTVTLAPGQQLTVDVELPAGKRFAGIVRDEKKQVLGGMPVRYYVRAADGSNKAGMVETDAQGQFEVKELDGEVLSLVQVERKGYVRWERRDIALPCDNLEIVLKMETALPFVVQTAPSEQWQVFLMRVDAWGSGTYAKQLLGREVASARVIGGSQDAFPSPPEGRYRIVAVGTSGTRVGVSDEIAWDPAKGLPAPVIVVPDKTGQLRVEFENAQIEQGELVATNMILPESLSAAEHAIANVEGDSAVLTNLPPGDYLVILTSSTFNASAINVRVEAGRMSTVRLRPMDLGVIEGRVRKGQTPQPGVRITIKSQTDASFQPKVTGSDEGGMFRIEGLPADLYVIEAEEGTAEQGVRHVRKSATIPPEGGTVSVEIDLAPPPRISFSLPASMTVKPGAEVVLLSRESGDTIRPEWRDGVLEASIAPGVYTVSVGDAPLGAIRIDAEGHVESAE